MGISTFVNYTPFSMLVNNGSFFHYALQVRVPAKLQLLENLHQTSSNIFLQFLIGSYWYKDFMYRFSRSRSGQNCVHFANFQNRGIYLSLKMGILSRVKFCQYIFSRKQIITTEKDLHLHGHCHRIRKKFICWWQGLNYQPDTVPLSSLDSKRKHTKYQVLDYARHFYK